MGVYFTDDFYNLLCESTDLIARSLVRNQNTITNSTIGNYVGISRKEGHLSYLPASKSTGQDRLGTAKGRVRGKPVRIMKKFMNNPDMFTEAQWDAFGIWVSSNKEHEIDVTFVTGEDIRFWYHEKNYAPVSGGPHYSCMRYEHTQHYFDFYVDNPEICSMACIIINNKLHGRCLVWTATDGSKWYDRSYATTKADAQLLRYFEENDIKPASRLPEHVEIRPLNTTNYTKIPYLDTLALREGTLVTRWNGRY